MTALTREKTHAVVASLARGRSVAMTAERCHVSPPIVLAVLHKYGPDLPKLEAAARELAKAPPKVAQLRPAATPPTGTHEPPVTPKDLPMTTAPASPTPTGPASFPAILDAIDAHVTDITDPRLLKLNQRAHDAVLALGNALDAHRKAAKVNAEIAALEERLAKARNERAKITGATIPGKRGGSTSLGPGVAKAVRAWAAANGVDAGTHGRVPGAAVDAWRAAGSPR